MEENIDRLLDAMEHPDRLSDDELNELLHQPATRDLYHILCKTADAHARIEEPDIDAEWQKFANNIQKPKAGPYRLLLPVFRRSTAAAIICAVASLAVVAATLGLKYSLDYHEEEGQSPEVGTGQSQTIIEIDNPAEKDTATTIEPLTESPGVIIFKNESLEQILTSTSRYYESTFTFKNQSKKELHLYFQWDQSLPLTEIVEQLDNFEQIDIKLVDNNLTVE